MANRLSVSVVINTYNRAKSLKTTLESLRYQTDKNFEVVVVNGPSTDETEEVVSRYDGKLKLVKCPQRNLSVSRNLGIEASAGEIVAFIDDDAIADPNWIRDIIDGYSDNDIGGVGGLVYDHTGMKLQYHYSACDRVGNTDFTITPPFNEYCIPGGEKFLYLQGTNCSFRKKCLELIGGFDEEFEYYLDEVDVAMRIIDKGYKIKPVDNAIVHHKYMQSFLRSEKKVVLHPYSTVKNKYYFALKNNRDSQKLDAVLERLNRWKEEVIAGGNWNLLHEKMTRDELDVYLKEVEEASNDGRKRGMEAAKTRKLSICKDAFLPFPIIERKEKPLKICYLSKEYPPINFGGIGRYTYDLATTFAAKGHEVHVITEGEKQDTVDFEDGVWVHRLVSRLYEPFETMSLGWNFSLQARNYFELERIHKQAPIDIVNGPIWLCETGMANCSNNYSTVMTLMTTQKILNGLAEDISEDSHAYKMMELEEVSLGQHSNIHAISSSILEKCNDSISAETNAFVAPLGCRDLSKKYSAKKNAEKIVIFSVGRMEVRKGTDLLLKAAELILSEPQYSNVEFVFAGKETTNTPSGISYKEEFIQRNAAKQNILNNVKFLGEISEDELMQYYSNADIACTPSRYESFGIVLLEGMSFSNAIVATKVGGMQSIIKDGQTGLFFELDNAEDLASKLRKLLDDASYRKQIAENARKEYEEVYSLDAVYKKLYQEYVAIINEPKEGEESEFNLKKYAEMIAGSENISVEKAEKAVTALLEKQRIMDIQATDLQGIELSSGLKICRFLYRLLRKIFPNLSVKLRNRWLRFYCKNSGMSFRQKLLSPVSKIYHVIVRIPIVGWVIRYLVNMIMMPIRMERTYRICMSLTNNDELLRQIGGMIEVQAKKTRDVTWLIEKEVRDILETQKTNEISEQMTKTLNEIVKKQANFFDRESEHVQSLFDEKAECLDNLLSEKEQKIKDVQIDTRETVINNLKYAVEDYSNILYDKMNKRITDVRSEILFELVRNTINKDVQREEIEPKVINVAKVESAIREKNIKLNIGAGHITFNDYLNVDERQLNEIDIVADVRKLPFEEESVCEIYASHLVEHFPKNDLVYTILPYWVKLLKKGGKLRVILPDLESMIHNYNDANYGIEDLREVLYGLQEYPGDIHYALYGQNELKAIFEENGLQASFAFVERKNGKCYDMEIVGIK